MCFVAWRWHIRDGILAGAKFYCLLCKRAALAPDVGR